jgi:hypothetical protein
MADMLNARCNVALAGLLDGLGWSISRLADEVNRELGTGYVSRSTASEWVNNFRVPRQPVPTVVAHVLSQAGGEHVAVSYLWPGVRAASGWAAADDGMQVPWDLHGTKVLLNHWFTGGTVFDVDRRNFMAVSGAALTVPAWRYVEHLRDVPQPGVFDQVLGGRYSDTKVTPGLVDYFNSLVGTFRRMDDLEGGSAENLKHVRQAVGQLTAYAKDGTFTQAGLSRQLVGVLAQVSQIGGWMAYDAERHGLAQRYFRTGLQAAHSVGDRNLGAHILACMSHQAVDRNRPGEAVELAHAAMKSAQATHPLVRAVVMARGAHAYAANGDLYGFRSATDQVATLLEQAHTTGGGPQYLYWLDPAMANTVQGLSMLRLTLKTTRQATSQLNEAERLLAAETSQHCHARPRDAYIDGAWLAWVHVKHGDLHKGLSIAETALNYRDSVSSSRARTVLGNLDKDLSNLRTGRHLPEVRALRKQLQPALAD